MNGGGSAQLSPNTFFPNFHNMHNFEWKGPFLEENGAEGCEMPANCRKLDLGTLGTTEKHGKVNVDEGMISYTQQNLN